MSKDDEKYKALKQEIELSNERLESLLRISQFQSNNIQELLDFALNEAINLTKSRIGYIYFYDEKARQFTLNTWSKEVMNECKVIEPQTVYDLDKTGIWGEAVRQREPIIINDFPAHNPLKKGTPEGHVALTKFLTIPVIFDNKIVAVVGVANKQTDYDNNDVRQLALLMDNVWKISERIRLIDELKRAKEKAEENELLLNLILEHSPILLFIKDENIRALRLSKNFEQLLGLPIKQMLGKNNSELFPNDFAKKMDEDDLLILKGNKTIRIEEEFEGRIYSTIKFPVQIEGRPRYLAGYTIDITDQKQAEKTIKQQNEELIKLNSDKDRFISILAHDLRNPFSTILGFLELLGHNLRKLSIDEIEEHIKIIDNMAQKTYNFLIDLLQWAKSQAGQLYFEPKEINLAFICDEIISTLNEQAGLKKVKIISSVENNIILIADPILIKGVLRNLISNAIKFSTQNGQVSVSCQKEEHQTVVIVADNGTGISEQNIEQLWDKSKPFTTVGTEGEEGTGLGLLLCKEFVELHGGKIWVESEVSKGSSFKFRIPDNKI